MLFAETPDRAWPELKNFNLAKKMVNGLVNANTTIKSTSVVSPNVKANPRTPPTANRYRRTAEIIETKSATTMVRRALVQPVSTAERRDRPSRISSRIRSK